MRERLCVGVNAPVGVSVWEQVLDSVAVGDGLLEGVKPWLRVPVVVPDDAPERV